MRLLSSFVCAALLLGCLAPDTWAQTSTGPARWAVLIEGLPGDEEHAALFRSTTQAWHEWLTQQLEFSAEHVIVCRGARSDESAGTRAATRDALAESFRTLGEQLKPNDGLWVFVLGHGDADGPAARIHLPGPDGDVNDVADWLAPCRCREQVVWLTQCCSNGFLPRLSRPGRIVVTATSDDGEVNETEMPHALAAVVQRGPKALDGDSDGRVTWEELLKAVVQETERRFASDMRLPTEYAQFDDNGDAKGTELGDRSKDLPQPAAGGAVDGTLCRRTLLPYREAAWQRTEPPPAAASTSPTNPAP